MASETVQSPSIEKPHPSGWKPGEPVLIVVVVLITSLAQGVVTHYQLKASEDRHHLSDLDGQRARLVVDVARTYTAYKSALYAHLGEVTGIYEMFSRSVADRDNWNSDLQARLDAQLIQARLSMKQLAEAEAAVAGTEALAVSLYGERVLGAINTITTKRSALTREGSAALEGRFAPIAFAEWAESDPTRVPSVLKELIRVGEQRLACESEAMTSLLEAMRGELSTRLR